MFNVIASGKKWRGKTRIALDLLSYIIKQFQIAAIYMVERMRDLNRKFRMLCIPSRRPHHLVSRNPNLAVGFTLQNSHELVQSGQLFFFLHEEKVLKQPIQ